MKRSFIKLGEVSKLSEGVRRSINRAVHLATADAVARAGSKEARDLYNTFTVYNKKYFRDKLSHPLVLITAPNSARTLGDYIERDPHGLESRIRIAPWAIKRGMIFAKDVLLHEMIHAWQIEVLKDGEPKYKGHGPKFAAVCNRIGEHFGLDPVGVKGSDEGPDCAYWPMNVRPPGFYGFEYAPPRKRESPDPRIKEIEQGLSEHLGDALERFDDVTLIAVSNLIAKEMRRRT